MWHLDGLQAQLNQRQAQATIDLARPELGVHGLRIGDKGLADLSLVQLKLTGSLGGHPIDCYVRDCDLVTTYQATGNRLLRTQLYYRALQLTESDVLALELIVSQQTDRLQSDPRLTAVTRLPARVLFSAGGRPEEAFREQQDPLSTSRGNRFLVPLSDQAFSCALLVHPSDVARVEVAQDQTGMTIALQLFEEQLEKGVIRRGRLRVFVLPRQADARRVASWYEDFLATPPPLTT